MTKIYDPEPKTFEAKLLHIRILDYLIAESNPKFSSKVIIRQHIDNLKDASDKENMKKYFEREFAGSKPSAWEYYKV